MADFLSQAARTHSLEGNKKFFFVHGAGRDIFLTSVTIFGKFSPL